VSGKVALGDKPLSGGQVTFQPDDAKGNKAQGMFAGPIGSDGTYSITTDGKPGAPLGWYKVTVGTMVPGGKPNPFPINSKYTNPMQSGLTVEVVENAPAGKYDLKVTK